LIILVDLPNRDLGFSICYRVFAGQHRWVTVTASFSVNARKTDQYETSSYPHVYIKRTQTLSVTVTRVCWPGLMR